MGMGGKANCLCLRGIWETPKPRYREETKPVVQVAWDHFHVTKRPRAFVRGLPDVACGRWAGGPSEETHRAAT